MTVVPERPAPATDLYAEAEVRRAARALLQTPLLHDGRHHDELALVRRHRDELTKLFADGFGYRLVVEPGLARLYKSGLGKTADRGLRRRNGQLFRPRTYAMLALVLAALTKARSQVMIDELVAGVRSAAVDAGVDVDLDAYPQRRAFHAALVALIDLGVVSERDGDLEHWVERHSESLLDVQRDRLAVLMALPLNRCDVAADVFDVTILPSSAGGSRVPIRRRLIEHSILSVDDLTEEQRGWWRRNRHREVEWFKRYLDLDLELRAEGAVAVDPSGELSDQSFPGAGSASHFALLLLAELVEQARPLRESDPSSGTWVQLPLSTARSTGDRIFATWKQGLRKAHREDPDALYDEALEILQDFGLVERHEAGLRVHAAAARYAPTAQLIQSPTSQPSLFEENET